MFPNKGLRDLLELENQENNIVLPITTEGVYEIIITSKDNKTVFTDYITSKDNKIILTGFSKHLYNVTLIPILINTAL